MAIRKAAVAGQFYAGTTESCIDEIRECIAEYPADIVTDERIVGAIVPHAGWVFSGGLAGAVFSAIRESNGAVDTFVIFGAAHRFFGHGAAVYDNGAWMTPLGEIGIDEELAGQIAEIGGVERDIGAHAGEHSIEVQVPFVQYLFAGAKIVPVLMPAGKHAVDIGKAVGKIIARVTDKSVVCIASTDLTHYGPRYGFVPAGTGSEGIKWAREVNDMEFIDLAIRMEADKLLVSAEKNCNACGAGACASVVAAAAVSGKEKGVLVGHTTSEEVMVQKFHQTSEESVGYAGIIF
ncbi:MAG: AmmeMemoRadiSam system protein B [Anaerohalosphaera sp.]|nr:AmmeMemoRadiSam system protein B [Anaerohalosphaera sp.]